MGGKHMPSSELMNLIISKYPRMTKAEKKVADFVLASPQKALNATITDLAKCCEVGDTSVFRFCKILNLNGYQDFRIALALSTSIDKSSQATDTAITSASDSSEDLSAHVLDVYKSAITTAYSSLNHKKISQAASILVNAEYIYFFGAGGSGLSAAEAHFKFSKIIPNVGYDTDLHQQITKASLMKPEYAAVIYCNSGITKDAILIAKLCHERNAKVIFITNFLHTPAKKYCDVILISGANEGPFEGGSITAKISQLFMMDILYEEVYRELGEQAQVNKTLTSEAIADKML